MHKITLQSSCTLALVFAGMLAAGSVLADKPSWAGGNKDGKHEQKDKGESQQDYKQGRDERSSHDREAPGMRENRHFGDQHRTVIHDYYVERFHAGRCPPGLAKKHNGCMPPGQAKKWTMGRPLPRDVVYYDLPPTLVVQLGSPPAGHRYVRVASDILMIAVGTGIVVDALQDLNGL
jgi:Ni/Co efflux regulator RcnB